ARAGANAPKCAPSGHDTRSESTGTDGHCALVLGQHRYGGRAASADADRIWHEWRRSAARPWRAGAAPDVASARLQEREIFVAHHRDRQYRSVRRAWWPRHLVRRNLNVVASAASLGRKLPSAISIRPRGPEAALRFVRMSA